MIGRPESLDQFIGQEKVKKLLKVAVESAKKRGEPLDHILFYGPPGTGKTTLSMIVAKELGKDIKIVSAPTIERKGDLVALITSLKEGDVLFIDEIHRLSKSVEESIYSAMEDFRIDVVTGSGKKRALSIELPPFTLIGATTRLNLLAPPFRSRFGIICRLELYTVPELKEIAKRNAEKLGIVLEDGALTLLARCSRGTPRVLNQLLKRFRDFATVHSWEKIDEKRAKKVLEELGIDSYGLDRMDRKILKTIAEVFKGGPVGLNTLAMVLKEDVETIENVHEPYLIEMGFIVKTPRGRKITPEGLKVIGYTFLPTLL
ncbi:MAG: Holliday junction branch migration DNA helicase RuvB [Desulfurobacterium sp.]|nr:MAG: Holliday junction branch migration DNA helicase RuvB [Desulfurobacterium sp.]